MKKIKLSDILHPKASPVTLPLALAALFTFVYNFAMLKKMMGAAFSIPTQDYDFNASIPFIPLCAFNFVFVLLCLRRVEKYIFSILIALSCLISYAQINYGTIFNIAMIRNIAETDGQEALSYLNPSLILWVAAFGALPLWLLWRTTIVYPTPKKEFIQKAKSIVATLAAIGVIAIFNFDDYATTVRNNIVLNKMPVPFYALKSTYKYVKEEYFQTPVARIALGEDAVQRPGKKKKELVVLIVGETQRAMSYQLNGYTQNTNEFTLKHGVISFRDVSSCGTATAYSVPCMFSNLSRHEFSVPKANAQDNILDIAQRAGVNVTWLDNDGGCKGVCTRIKYEDIRKKFLTSSRRAKYCPAKDSCYDEVFLPALDETLPALPKDRDNLLVLHVMGSHGPTYFERYPLAFQKFLPDCDHSDVQNCTHQELLNEYDNTIRYFDYVMAEIIEKLKTQKQWNTSLIFVSDHGESLGENGIYLHGLPYMFAPKEQTHVPFIVWLSWEKSKEIDTPCLQKKAVQGSYGHDNIFDTLLGAFRIDTKAYRPEKDIFKDCRRTGL